MHDLIKRYVEETVRHLPVKEREEVALELETNIEDMLGGDSSTEKVEETLLALGSPAILARQYRGKERYLIGPETFDLYVMVLKIVSLVVGLVTMVITFISLFFAAESIGLPQMIAEVLASVFSGLSSAFLYVTITFAIMSYYQVNTELEEWNLKALHALEEAPTRRIKKSDSIGEMVGLSIFFVLLVVLYSRSDLIALYRKGAEPIPLFISQAMKPYIIGWMITTILTFSVAVVKYAKQFWNTTLFAISALADLVGLCYFIFLSTRWSIYNPDFLAFIPGSMARWQIIIKAACTVLLILTLISLADDAYTVFRRTRPNESGKEPAR
ncbi:MAG: hypothetical protein GX626_01365 [Spirochaetales bacterium]|nr:hypothetical protein [Spirochaetales bacterium]